MAAPAIYAALAGLATFLLALGVLRRGPATMIRRRVHELEVTEVAPAQRSFAERVIIPMGTRVWETIASLLPRGLEQRLSSRLDAAGLRVSVGRFLAAWAGFGFVAPVLMMILVLILASSAFGTALIPLLAWLGGGVALPGFMVSRMARNRIEVIERSLSDAMDLIVTNVEAGVGLQAALINVTSKSKGPLTDELTRAIREISLGRSRDEALDAMARRTGSREMALFARAVAQAERNGVPIARVLRAQSSELRERRRQAARERANTFPLRITLLTVMFIFPTLFLLLLGPVALNVLDFFAD